MQRLPKMRDYDHENYRLLTGHEINEKGDRKFIQFKDVNAFLNYYNKVKNKYFYEYYTEHHKIKPFFDLDIYTNNPNEDGLACTDIVHQTFKLFMEKKGYNLSEPMIATSPTKKINKNEYKMSYHLFYHKFYFKNITICKNIIKEFINEYPEMKKYVDLSVYANGKNLRMLYSIKRGENELNRVKTPASDGEFKDYLVTHIDSNAQLLNVRTVPKKKKSIPNKNKDEEFDYNFIEDILNCLSQERCDDYNQWIEVGFALNSLGDRYFNLWLKWSEQSEKFDAEVCEQQWNNIKDKENGITAKSLPYWAKQDNINKYNKVVKKHKYISSKDKEIIECIVSNLNNDDFGVGLILKKIYGNTFALVHPKRNLWYYYNGVHWTQDEGGMKLRKMLSRKVRDYYYKALTYETNFYGDTTDDNEDDQTKDEDKINSLFKFTKKLCMTSYKQNILKEAQEHFFESKFEEKLNIKKHLLCFTNGVYDFKLNKFREGRVDDYTTLTIGYAYTDIYNENDMEDLMKYINQVFPNQEKRDYILRKLYQSIAGDTSQNECIFMTGCGSNGKSTFMDNFLNLFLNDSLDPCNGGYITKVPLHLITQTQKSGPLPELLIMKGRKLYHFAEPSITDSIKDGLFKDMTGNENLVARGLYQSCVKFKPSGKHFMSCNKLPRIDDTSYAMWRRIKCFEMDSKFVDDPNLVDEQKNIYLIDPTINDKLIKWRIPFFHLLMTYRDFHLLEPTSIVEATLAYQNSENIFKQFVNEYIERKRGAKINAGVLKNRFMEWLRSNYSSTKKLKTKEIYDGFATTKLGSKPLSCIYKGWKIKE